MGPLTRHAADGSVLALSSASIEAGRTLTADGSGSSDPDAGDTIEASVDWGDGNVTAWSAARNATHA